jgi:hypothetical protein
MSAAPRPAPLDTLHLALGILMNPHEPPMRDGDFDMNDRLVEILWEAAEYLKRTLNHYPDCHDVRWLRHDLMDVYAPLTTAAFLYPRHLRKQYDTETTLQKLRSIASGIFYYVHGTMTTEECRLLRVHAA